MAVTLAGLVVALVLVSVGGGGGGPGAVVAPGPADLHVTLSPAAPVHLASGSTGSPAATGGSPTAAAAPAVPWAATGQSAVSIPALGWSAQSGAEQPVPVASMTKIMTAYLVLADHPLAPGQQGPTLTMSTADAWNYGTDTATDQASVLVQAGEQLSEYQLLEGLLVHSANDFAYILATWDAGSVAAFVAKMNATAAKLGMGATHFADASGYLPGSVSTAADLLRVAGAAMANPVFSQIVREGAVTLPAAGLVSSYTPLLTVPGVVGVKSGFTSAAGGGDVLAYQASVGGAPLVVLAAVTSQEGPTVLAHAGHQALAIAQAAAAQAGVAPVVSAGQRLGRATVTGRPVTLTAARSATLPALASGMVRQHVTLWRRARRRGDRWTVGTASFRLGTETVSVPVVAPAGPHRTGA